MSTPSRELLIVSPERWDELCFSIPAVRALAGSGLGIGVLCQEHQRALWETLPGLSACSPESLEEEWQVALLWETGPLAKLVRKAGILKRIGPQQASKGKLTKQLTEVLKDAPHPTSHRVQFYLKAVAEMGVETAKPEYFAPAEPPTDRNPDSLLVVADSDFGPSHEWSLDRWAELIGDWKQDHSVTIGHLEGGRDLGRQLAERLEGELPSLTLSLDQPPIHDIARHARVVAADGSLPHLAAHLGATCLTLFGPNDPQWKRPLGKRHRVARRHVECAPCLMAKCPLDLRCQHELDADTVREDVRQLTN